MKKRIALLIFAIFITGLPAMAEFSLTSDDDQEESPADREAERYDDGTDALDDQEWRRAAESFREVAAMKGKHAAGALHWLAYAQNKMGQRSEALSTLVDLQKQYPKSKWAEDGKALEVEIRQSAGQRIEPENVDNEELKLMALNGLMNSNPERAIPILEKVIRGNGSSKMKEKAIFVLSQSGSPRALEMLSALARDAAQPELQSKAIRNLGILGGEPSRKILADVYTSSNDSRVKRAVLKSYMIAGDKGRLLTLARGEKVPELRAEAVQQLGIMGARQELAELYSVESSVEVRKKIIQAMFIGGNAEKLAELARTEKVLELRLAAIKSLGLMGGQNAGPLLVSIYESDHAPEVKKAAIQGLFLQNNAKALVALARKEKDRGMKKQIVSKLSIMGSEESATYLMELLNQ